MQVKIKEWGINPYILNNGIELEIRTPDGTRQKGDLFVTCTGLIWCKGRTQRDNGKKIDWDDFIKYMNSLQA